MKELLRKVLFREYQKNLHDYLLGFGFNEEEAKEYEAFAELSMTKDIQMEQIYERAIPVAMKNCPGLCLELMKYANEIEELEFDYAGLGGDVDFKVVRVKEQPGVFRIFTNR